MPISYALPAPQVSAICAPFSTATAVNRGFAHRGYKKHNLWPSGRGHSLPPISQRTVLSPTAKLPHAKLFAPRSLLLPGFPPANSTIQLSTNSFQNDRLPCKNEHQGSWTDGRTDGCCLEEERGELKKSGAMIPAFPMCFALSRQVAFRANRVVNLR